MKSENEKMQNMDYGLVSIIMPNYNGARFLSESIESVLNQTYKNWELIFVDDCSTDNSLEMVMSYNDERIRVIKNQKNSGAAITRNNAIKQAKGRWIAFLDSDDKWKEEKLEKQLKFMIENNYSFTFTHYQVVNGQGEEITVFKPKKNEYDYKTICKHCYIGCLTVIYDKEKLGEVLMPPEAVKREDFACWLSILKTGVNAVCLHEDLATYRVHNGSVSSNKLKIVKYHWNVYRKIEKLNFFKSMYLMMHWAIKGFFKYKK